MFLRFSRKYITLKIKLALPLKSKVGLSIGVGAISSRARKRLLRSLEPSHQELGAVSSSFRKCTSLDVGAFFVVGVCLHHLFVVEYVGQHFLRCGAIDLSPSVLGVSCGTGRGWGARISHLRIPSSKHEVARLACDDLRLTHGAPPHKVLLQRRHL